MIIWSYCKNFGFKIR